MDRPPPGLRRQPFADTADPDVFYRSPMHESACAELFAAAKKRGGLLVLCGEPGTGKTTVLRRVARDVERAGGRVLWCSDVAPLHEMVAARGGQPGAPDDAETAGRESVLANLRARVRLDRATLVAVDEAQRLEPAELEALHELADAGSASGPPPAVLLVGQPGLDVKLARLAREGSGRAFALRIPLSRLEASEVGAYLAYRLGQAGARPEDVFQADAIERIAALAEGIPRMINQLCDATLHASSEAGLATASAAAVDTAARWLDLPDPDWAAFQAARHAAHGEVPTTDMVPASPARGKRRAWAVGLGTLLVVGGLLYVFRPESHPPSLKVPAPVEVRVTQRLPAPPAPQVAQPAQPAAPGVVERHQAMGRTPAHVPSGPPPSLRGATPSRRVPTPPAPAVARGVLPTGLVLLGAAEAGNLAEARALLAAGALPDTRDGRGMTPLMTAVIQGHGAVTRLLLDRGADVNARDDSGVTALMLAANNDRKALLQTLLERGAGVNARNQAGWTALIYAAWKGYPDIARRLLAAGADAALTDRNGWTALQYATWRAADVTRAGAPDAADPSAADDPRSAAAAHVRYVELVGLLGRVTRPR